MRRNDELIPALAPASYNSLDRSYQRKEKKCESTIDKSWLGPIVALVSAGLDGTVLFSILDQAITQSELMGWIVTAGVALALNLLPLVIAKYVKEVIYKLRRNAMIPMIMLTVLFVLLYASTVLLRFAYSDLNGGDKQTKTQLVNMSASSETITEQSPEQELEDLAKEREANKKSLAVTILLSLSPLVTSIIAFGIAFSTDDVVQKRVRYLEGEIIRTDQAISDISAAIEAMEDELQRDLGLDEEEMKSYIEMIIAKCNALKAEARWFLAKYLADPSATSLLSSEMSCDLEEMYLSNGETQNKNEISFPENSFKKELSRAERGLV